MLRAIYNCTQQELYTICNLGWVSCNQNLADFSSFKAKYTMVFITTRQADVAAAQLLPDDQQRGEVAESLRVQLQEQSILCLNAWQKLKRYIADAYQPSLQKAKNEAAGQNYYATAASENWDDVQGLMTSGFTFITTNLADLTANQNMPATFEADFTTLRSDFNSLHQDFLDKEENAKIQTEEKQLANNNIYSALISMFLDGQEIYKNQPAIKKLFVFDQVLQLVSGPGVAGFKGIVTDNTIAHTPVPNATITIVETGVTTITGPDGKYQLSPVPAGTYQVTVHAVGYQPFIIAAQEVLVGTISTLNVTLNILAP
jgi:hypothetical protein